MAGATMMDLEAGLRDHFTDVPTDLADVLNRFVSVVRVTRSHSC
jgi:hypothetical protein